MKNILILIFLTVLTFGCTTNKPVTSLTVIEPTQKVDLVEVISTKGFTVEEEAKLKAYIPVMNKTIASECFKDFIEARPGLHSTEGRTASQVVKHLRTSRVKINLVTYYKRFSRVHGYTYPNVNTIWLNRKYHAGASLCSEASNLAHELSHKLGYTHSYKASKIRPFSVPYSINAAFKACCK